MSEIIGADHGCCSSENESSGFSSGDHGQDDEVIEVSLKSIEEAETVRQKRSRALRRRKHYAHQLTLQGRTSQSSNSTDNTV
jgi:hypothetical protein